VSKHTNINLSFFTESPDYYEDGVFHGEMNDDSFNKDRLQLLLPSCEELASFKGYKVFKRTDSFDEDNVSFFLIKDDLIQGATEIISKKQNNFCLGVWQRKSESNRGLLRSFYLEGLPNYFSSIISDKSANKFGKNFWKKLLEQAKALGHTVTVLEGSLKKEVPYDVETFENFWRNVNQDIPTFAAFVASRDRLFKITFKN
jgi:hypothetical protein